MPGTAMELLALVALMVFGLSLGQVCRRAGHGSLAPIGIGAAFR